MGSKVQFVIVRLLVILLLIGGFSAVLELMDPGLVQGLVKTVDDGPISETGPENPATDEAAIATLDQEAAQQHSNAPIPPPVGPIDPYAAGQQALAEGGYAAQKARVLEQFGRLTWAVRCRVIMPVDATVISLMLRRQLAASDPGGADQSLEQDIGNAGENGEAIARSQGCGYWLQNPQAVAAIREQAGIASLQ